MLPPSQTERILLPLLAARTHERREHCRDTSQLTLVRGTWRVSTEGASSQVPLLPPPRPASTLPRDPWNPGKGFMASEVGTQAFGPWAMSKINLPALHATLSRSLCREFQKLSLPLLCP